MKTPSQTQTRDSAVAISALLSEATRTIERLDRGTIDGMVECLLGVWRRRGVVYTMGNGGSASTATHFAADLAKYTIAEGKPRFKVLGLTDNVPLVSTWTNDDGFNSIYSEQLLAWLQRGDALVGFSLHGGSHLRLNTRISRNARSRSRREIRPRALVWKLPLWPLYSGRHS